jgi:CubicO group peptidase (beta-lactamase class C family)
MSLTAIRQACASPADIHGDVGPGFEPVFDAFAENFSKRHELGGACAVYQYGDQVVDLWGGVRNDATGEPWERDTMVLVHSATMGLSAMTLALAHSRGWLDYDERVCRYWPEFARNGKDRITVRQLLAHQAGLFAFDEQADRCLVGDLDRLAVVLARQTPAWEPGTRQGYHAITIGYYENELLRRVDPEHRSIGVFFHEEIASPLDVSVYIRLPESIPASRLATLNPPGRLAMLWGLPERVYTRNLEVPAAGGVGTARGIARAYSEFATGGYDLHLRPATLKMLSAPAVPPAHGFYDEFLRDDWRYSLGFMKPGPVWPFGSESAFGAPGAGGSFGFADPQTGIGYAYVTSRMGTSLTADPRDLALRKALDSIVRMLP